MRTMPEAMGKYTSFRIENKARLHQPKYWALEHPQYPHNTQKPKTPKHKIEFNLRLSILFNAWKWTYNAMRSMHCLFDAWPNGIEWGTSNKDTDYQLIEARKRNVERYKPHQISIMHVLLHNMLPLNQLRLYLSAKLFRIINRSPCRCNNGPDSGSGNLSFLNFWSKTAIYKVSLIAKSVQFLRFIKIGMELSTIHISHHRHWKSLSFDCIQFKRLFTFIIRSISFTWM